MKILHVITHLAVGGATYNTIINSYGHIQKGCEVDVLAGYDEVMDIEGDLQEFAAALGVKVTFVKTLKRKISLLGDLISLFRIYFYIKNGNYDVIHTHSSKAGVLGRIAGRMAGVKVIVHTVHGWSFNDSMSILKRNTYIFLERILANVTSKLVVVTKMDIKKGLDNKIGNESLYELIRSGIDIELFQSGEIIPELVELRKQEGVDFIIGTVGRLSHQKSPLDYVKMVGYVVSQKENVRFVMVGDGVLREQVEREVKNKGLGKYITILGKSDNVPGVLAGLDIFVLTSLWEGLPRVLPESMAAGIPVISTSVDGAVEVIKSGENGFLVEPGDMEQMAKYCLKLIDNQDLRESIIKNSSDTVNEFSHQKMIDDLYDLFKRLYDSQT